MLGSGELLLILAVGDKLGEVTLAEQLAPVPPLLLVQLHDHGPDPETVPADPELQRFEVGAERKAPPLEEPQLAGVPQPRVTPFALEQDRPLLAAEVVIEYVWEPLLHSPQLPTQSIDWLDWQDASPPPPEP